MKNKILLLLLLSITTIFAQKPAKKVAPKKPVVTAPKVIPIDPTDGVFATFETTKGTIICQLEFDKTPITVANFVSLAEGTNTAVTNEKLKGKPFYDGLKFHRVIPNFMIQGGDPEGNGSGGAGYAFLDEFIPQLKFDKGGILAMANSGPATNSSQFFITHNDTSWLNGKHTIFGHVTSGMEVVNAITQDDIIKKITISRKGVAGSKFDAAKTFSDYNADKVGYAKKQLEKLELAKKAFDLKYAPVRAKTMAYLNAQKATAIKTASGLQYKIIAKGAGKKPADGAKVYINYAGFLQEGTLFDSCVENVNRTFGKFNSERAAQNGYNPLEFSYGAKTGLIPGFIEGLNNMSFGDKAILYIPSNLGYGERGAGNVIPPNTDIIFEVELLENPPTPKATIVQPKPVNPTK